MNYTTIEQSKKLLELGLSPETADMYWGYDDHYTTTPKEKDYSIIAKNLNPSCRWDNVDPYLIPCWSLGAFLAMIPEEIKVDDLNCLAIMYLIHSNYSVRYIHDKTGDTIKETHGTTPINAAFDMIVWLLENGYIKTKKI